MTTPMKRWRISSPAGEASASDAEPWFIKFPASQPHLLTENSPHRSALNI